MRRFFTVPTAILAAFLIAGCTSSDTAATEETTANTEAPATTAASGATVVAAATTTAPSGADESTTEGVSSEVEEEITALIDAWMAAWNEGDGQAAVDLFTDDGKWMHGLYAAPGQQPLDGLSGEALAAEIDSASGLARARDGNPLIIVRDNTRLNKPDSYRVAQSFTAYEYGEKHFELYNIVEVEGGLKLRYVERWMELGWYRLTEDQPWQGNKGGE